MLSDCIFCGIIAGSQPCVKLYEDDLTLAFLDINPVAKGHTLVIPKVHSTNLYDINPEDISAISQTVVKLTKALKKTLQCDGINIYQGNEQAAMQVIMHTHFHIIPRFFDDQIMFGAPREALVVDQQFLSNLRSNLD